MAFDVNAVFYFILQVNKYRTHHTSASGYIYNPCGSCLTVCYSSAGTILLTDPCQIKTMTSDISLKIALSALASEALAHKLWSAFTSSVQGLGGQVPPGCSLWVLSKLPHQVCDTCLACSLLPHILSACLLSCLSPHCAKVWDKCNTMNRLSFSITGADFHIKTNTCFWDLLQLRGTLT